MVLSVKNVSKKIANYKKKLEKRCKEEGIYENFGQNEILDLESYCADATLGTPLEREIRPYIKAFKEWCENYRG